MAPIFKRIFGQGKSKASNPTLAALCIGDYSRITRPIEGREAHQLQSLLASGDAELEKSPPCTSHIAQQPTSNKSGLGSQSSFRPFRHLLQHFGGGAGSSSSPSQDGAELDARQQLSQFLTNLGGYSSVAFLPAAEDGLVSRDKALGKLTKLFKHSTAPVVLVSYCGPSDERGNWRLASQAPVAGGGGGSGGSAAVAAGGGGGSVLSFREISMLWQRYRRHSQRLVLLLDCPNSGYWVAALRMLSKAEQLELSLGVQASDCRLPAAESMQLTYQPGVFTQFYLVNNKWRADSARRNAAPGNPQPQQQQQQNALPKQDPQQQQQLPPKETDAADAGGGGGPTAVINVSKGGGGGSINGGGGPRGEQWLPGMTPSYYATWLNENLVDYGIALRFFNTQATSTGATAAAADGGGGGDSLFPISPMGAAELRQRAWRASTGPLAVIDSSKSLLGRPSRVAGEGVSGGWGDGGAASPLNDALGGSKRLRALGSAGAYGGGGGAGQCPGGMRSPGLEQDMADRNSPDHASGPSPVAIRAVSLHDPARRRFSTFYNNNCTTDGAGPAGGCLPFVGGASPATNPAMQRVRLSVPQAEWRRPLTLPCTFSTGPGRSPTLPGDDLLYKLGHDTDGSGTTLPHLGSQAASHIALHVFPPCASSYCELLGGSGSVVAAAATAGGSRLQGYSGGSGAVAAAATCGSAVHITDIEVSGYDTLSGCADGGGGAAADGEEQLVVQPSAQSDTVAVAWDRRSAHAERCLDLAEEERRNGGPLAASFTGPPTQRHSRSGFANELYDALHDVATERRLRARRAPLEGDESLNTMMEDADVERRVSVASLPSAMMPRNLGGGGGRGGEAAAAGRVDSSGSISCLMTQASAAAEPLLGGGGGVPSAFLVPTPRTSVLLGLGLGGESVAATAAADRVPSLRQRGVNRQGNRLVMVSVAASRSSGGQMSAGQLGQLDEDGDGGAAAAGAGGADMEAGFSMTGSYDRKVQGAAAGPQGPDGEGKQAQQRRQKAAAGRQRGSPPTCLAAKAAPAAASGIRMYHAAMELLATRGSSSEVQLAVLESTGAAAEAAPASQDWPQHLESSLLPAKSTLPLAASGPLGHRKASGRSSAARAIVSEGGSMAFKTSGGMLRNVLRNRNSVAGSMDLDSMSIGGGAAAVWQRRPGRFEMAGSERSSFIFGDDRERFEALQMLRGGQGQGQRGDQDSGEATAATGRRPPLEVPEGGLGPDGRTSAAAAAAEAPTGVVDWRPQEGVSDGGVAGEEDQELPADMFLTMENGDRSS